jgi:hypothetical protein
MGGKRLRKSFGKEREEEQAVNVMLGALTNRRRDRTHTMCYVVLEC